MDEKNSEDHQNWTLPKDESNLAVRGIFLNSIISKLDRHVLLLLVNYIFSHFCVEFETTASSSPTGMSSKALCPLRAKRQSLNTLSRVDVLWFPSIMAFKSVSARYLKKTSYFLAGSLLAARPQKLRQINRLKQKSRSPFCKRLVVRQSLLYGCALIG